jgi:hypothetical protein
MDFVSLVAEELETQPDQTGQHYEDDRDLNRTIDVREAAASTRADHRFAPDTSPLFCRRRITA